MRKFLSFLICAFITISGITTMTPPAFAHAGVISSNPLQDQVLTVLPDEISVTFSEELLILADKEINTLTLARSDGSRVTVRDVRVVENRLIAQVPNTEYLSGIYEITYRVISADGHEVSGAISFSLQISTEGVAKIDASGEEIAIGEESDLNISPLAILAFLAALLLAAFLLFTRRRSSK